ncbi:hypothetical protein CXG81DRAFT_16455 [Caulochytrium protostelioides]|uniref:Protein YOP1 n=1 Tax=Caulochytrium protostelioides TaxID=1555241 RepID=A0A4P9XER7_9FUNG|nr:hypothetical protein CXG81DRAFT_16455 [Caulochytrium protostelioides]|eukprot:RKP04028.1 hypothetical protein CXG81DRAFT_16455 [Caulochytrium protostelioides]
MADKLSYYLAQFDKELTKIPLAVEAERRTQVPKTYSFGTLGVVTFIFIFFNVWASFITTLIGFVYPAYRSFKAIESHDKDDDTAWLVYWTVFGFATVLEHFVDVILYWVPLYYVFKTAFLLYLILPQFNGARVIYYTLVRPRLMQNEHKIDSVLGTGAATAKPDKAD